jgi:hypothetical protein
MSRKSTTKPAGEALEELLSLLRERQSFCPACGGEYVHRGNDCCLSGRWFQTETDE